jgi:hypothetical protein
VFRVPGQKSAEALQSIPIRGLRGDLPVRFAPGGALPGDRIVGILTPGEGGAPGVESRWRLEPAHRAGGEGWVLSRLRARDGGPGDWAVARGAQGQAQVVERAVEGV